MSYPSNMATQAATGSTTWATCIKVTTTDGLIIGLTDHDVTLTVDLGDGDGSVSYLPSDASEFSEPRLAADLSIDNVEVVASLDDARIAAEDIHKGRYDGATVTRFQVDWSNPSAGQYIDFSGPVGNVETTGEQVTFEVKSLQAILSRNVGQSIGAQCRKSFGSSSATERRPNTPCGVDLTPSAWAATTAYTAISAGDRLIGSRVKPTSYNGYWYACTTAGTSDASEPTWPTTIGDTVADGTVVWTCERALAIPGVITSVTSNVLIGASGVSISSDFLSLGWVQWDTGDNAAKGVKRMVATDDGAGALLFYSPTPEDIQVGDTFTAYAGCNKSQTACIAFSNWINHNGCPYVPPKTI